MRQLSDGERELWNEMQRDAAPDIRVLWDKQPVARKAHRCARCGDEIKAGERYESTGIITDGVLEATKQHRWAYQYPSGCPVFGERDRAELLEQESAERQQYGESQRAR
jgi:hypothetical protein